MALESTTRREGPVAIVSFQGKITLGDASQSLRNVVDQLVAEGTPQIVLNLSAVPFIDSAGLGALTVSFKKTETAGGGLKLAEPQRRVEEALEMTRLTRLFPLYRSESEAVASFPKAAGAVPSGQPAL